MKWVLVIIFLSHSPGFQPMTESQSIPFVTEDLCEKAKEQIKEDLKNTIHKHSYLKCVRNSF